MWNIETEFKVLEVQLLVTSNLTLNYTDKMIIKNCLQYAWNAGYHKGYYDATKVKS